MNLLSNERLVLINLYKRKQVKSKRKTCDRCRKYLERLVQHRKDQLTDKNKIFILSVGLFNSCIKFWYWYCINSSWNIKEESNWLTPEKTTLKKPSLIRVKLNRVKITHRKTIMSWNHVIHFVEKKLKEIPHKFDKKK